MKRIYYKYFGIGEGTHGIENIKNSLLWASEMDTLNDIFECEPRINRKDAVEALKEKKKSEIKLTDEEWYQNLDNFMDILLGITNKKIGIKSDLLCTSLTLDPFNIIMWSHYADKHRGVCVGYEIDDDEIMFLLGSDASIDPVNYSYERIFWPAEIFINFNGKEPKMVNLLKITMCHKSKIWEYEKEYRITFTGDEESREKGFKLFPAKIKEIYLGNQIDLNKKEEILKICQDKKFLSVKIFEIKKDLKGYNLYPVLIK